MLTLQTTLNKCTSSYQLTDHSFVASSVLQQIKQDKCLNTDIISLRPLIDEQVCGCSTVRKMAASGLALNHLQLAYSRSGQTGLQLVFGDRDQNNLIRVTKNNKIIEFTAKFLSFLVHVAED